MTWSTRFGVLGVLTFLPAVAQVSSVVVAQDSSERISQRLGKIQDLVQNLDGTADSTNWSGYAVLGSSFTSAQGSWIVPAVNCSGVRGDQYSAFWVGIDGYSSATVEQTGTLSDCVGTTPSYVAWYEFYPAGLVEIGVVNPGDKISASVTWVSGSTFSVTITDETNRQTFTKTGTVSGASRSSAEWITEAPCCTGSGKILPLADFGTADFGSDYTGLSGTNYATDGSNSGPISSFGAANVVQITKVGSRTSPQTSTCSALSGDGTSFSCTWAK